MFNVKPNIISNLKYNHFLKCNITTTIQFKQNNDHKFQILISEYNEKVED